MIALWSGLRRKMRWARVSAWPRPSGRQWLGFALLAATVAITVAGVGRLRVDTTTASFLPADDPAQHALQEAARSFGGDPVVILAESAEPGRLLAPGELSKLVQLEGALAGLPDVAVTYGPGTVLNQLAGSAQNLLATLSGRRDAVRAAAESQARATGAGPAEVTAAGARAVEQFDLRYGSLLVRGLPAGLPTLHNPAFVGAVVFDQNGNPRRQWRFVVPTSTSVAILVRPREGIDQAATESLVAASRQAVEQAGLVTTRLTVTGMPVVAADLGAQVQQEIPLLGAIALGAIASCYLLLPWLPRHRHRVVPVLATLAATALTLAAIGWLGRPVSLGVVAFLPILVGIGSDFPAYLVRGAGRRQVLVTALAAAVGFASLGLSPVPFVRDLGLALAAGVLVAVGVAALMARRISRPVLVPAAPETPEPAPARGRRATLLLLSGCVAVVGWCALPGLAVESRPERLAEGLPSLTAAQHAESVLGSAGEVQILARGADVLSPAALEWMRQAEDVTIRQFGDRLRPIVSLPDLLAFLGESPTPEQITAGLQQLPRYLTGAVVRDDGKLAVLSFGIGLGDVGKQRDLLADVRAALPPPPPGMSSELVGLPVVTARGYDLVSDNRYLANLAGIAGAGLVLAIGLARRSDALRAVLAALLATGWGFAGAWAAGIALTPLTVALGSLATATACEFSVLLGHARARRSTSLRRAVVVAATAASVGYLALAASGLPVVREFGLVLAVTVLLSLAAAHVVVRLLPARPVPALPAGETCARPKTEVKV
ncbi:RND transporter family protein [Amycolatopsis thermoflava]|uniref:RND transporter n=1 Tax=Amycolatopsis thermoflava TaxID=84480 RepID=UPI003806B465